MSKMSRATRWCPTPEQLIILQELYRGGLRTPKAPLIQKITAHLSLYGKIQGKNVFYWFQNHKARDRQKLRKILSKQLLCEQQEMNYIQTNHLVVYPHLHSNPHPSGYHHQPQHGSATFIYQGMTEDTSTGGYYVWKMGDDFPKSYEAENGLMTTSLCRHDCVMMEGPASALPSCNSNNNRPLQTLDLFPTRTHLFQRSNFT